MVPIKARRIRLKTASLLMTGLILIGIIFVYLIPPV